MTDHPEELDVPIPQEPLPTDADGTLEGSTSVAEESVPEETVAREITEVTVTEEPVTEESVTEEPVPEETVTEEPVTEESVTEESVIPETVPEATVTEAITEETVPVAPDEAVADAAAPDATPVDAPPAPPIPVPVPSPAIFAKSHAAPTASAFGRVDADGLVYVKTPDGERPVGSYPGASPGEALAYFARKYDELAASVQLLHQRVTQTEMPTKEAVEALAKLREQTTDARAVGDLAALEEHLGQIDTAISQRREAEAAARAEAKLAATTRREQLVAEAEQIAGQPEHRIQWKTSGARMRELLDEWKAHQRSGPRLDKDVEAAMWQRFSAARNGFDKARRSHFAQLDAVHGQARSAKERLVAEAERMATSKDWAATASAFKRLMDEWRQAGRASRTDDDALWTRFKAAQDAFFAAKDAVVQAEEEGYRANLQVKEALLVEAETILPVTDLAKAKARLRVIQDKWDKAGKVPRADLERTERAMRRIEQAVRDAEDKKWSASNPEAAARASSFVEQLEKAVAGLEKDLAAAQAGGNARKVAEAESALAARRQWLDQARSGLAEFGGR